MRRDVKIGMMAGTALVIISFIIFSVSNPFKSQADIEREKISLETQTPANHFLLTSPEEPPVTAPKVEPIIEVPIYPDIEETLQSAQQPLAKPKQAPAIETSPSKHIVSQGETLSSISLHYYGTTAHWKKILLANKKTLKSPNSLRLGMELTIPKID